MASIENSIGHIKRPSKKSIRFSLMVAGQSRLGKTTFLATLFDGLLTPPRTEESQENAIVFAPTREIKAYNLELEAESNTRLQIEVFDTPGYGDDRPAEIQARMLLEFLERQFDKVFEEEQRIHRNPKFEEHRVHALLYFLEPTALGLKQFDIDFMKLLASRVNVIPVIAKADGLTVKERESFKTKIMNDIAKNDIAVYDMSMGSERDDSVTQALQSCLPFAVIGSSFPHDENKRGRRYKWGFVDCDDSKNCDLAILQKVLLSLARDDLRDYTEDSLYEKYRTEKLLSLKGEEAK